MSARLVWITLLAAALLVFFAYEIPAVANRVPGDTLSETLRWLLHTGTAWCRYLWLGGWFAFAVWFGIHIASKGGWGHGLFR